ncbi:hypothetical protein C1645_24848 [Glomus cerebriforme]|uniref:Phosphatidylglycerol/phosphatidylinositol transfer protein n=1 Tax=Glomus cerebriforme TaxID=658196 RepID=A0A397S7H8_9GLOM|nr:hypothetical protein C1645_24848 [Glomus cerebriforme]
MKQNFILVAILLATLSIVNALPHQLNKRATTFIPCPGNIPFITTTLTPDPPTGAGANELITISGTLPNPVVAGSKLVIGTFDPTGTPIGAPLTLDFCTMNGATCPEEYFSLIQPVTMPSPLPTSYMIITAINDPNGNALGCSVGTINT